MSHFAELDDNNIVIRVLVGDNALEDEGASWFPETFGGRWVKTSYNTQGGVHKQGGVPFRKNFALPGYFYDSEIDAFIPPKPLTSWVLDQETCYWVAPIPYPTDGLLYSWDEEKLAWVLDDLQVEDLGA